MTDQNRKRYQIGRKRRLSETLSPERLIKQSEEAIKALKRHSDKGSCPKSLQYKARARIRADNDFKSDIKRIRNQAEQGIVSALTSFHERQIQKHRIALKRQKRPIAPRDTKVVHRNTDGNKNRSRSEIAHSAKSDTNVTTNNVTKIAESIQNKFNEFNNLLSKFQESFNKDMKQYTCLLSESPNTNEGKRVTNNPSVAHKKRKERKKFKRIAQKHETFEANKKHIKKLSNIELTSDQVNLVAKGLKFIPTPVTNDNLIRRQLLQDFNDFARRMRLQYIFHGKNEEPHPFHVKSNWELPVQPSVALESYLERVKFQLAEIQISKLKNNLPPAERKALKDLKNNT